MPAQQKLDWLFMFYMVANESDKLDRLAVQDLLEIEKALAHNRDVQALVQIHRRWPAALQRYHIAKTADATTAQTTAVPFPVGQDSSVSMGKGETLRQFLEVGRDRFPAERYCLVLWGHMFGLGFGRDHGDALQLVELRDALDAFAKLNGRPIDLLGANTCTLAYAEAVYELRTSASYMVASEGFVPFAGWPYDRILKDVRSVDTRAIGQLILDRYLDYYTQPDVDAQVSMTLLDLGRAELLQPVVQNLALGIRGAIGSDAHSGDVRAQIQDAFFANPAGMIRPVLDLVGLASDLSEVRVDPASGSSSRDRFAALRSATECAQQLDNLVIGHKRHPSLEELHGLGIFAPFVVDDGRLEKAERSTTSKGDPPDPVVSQARKGLKEYRALDIFQAAKCSDTNGSDRSARHGAWPDIVIHDLRRQMDDDIVDSSGVVRPVDRSAISHLVAAVDAAFRRLDRSLSAAKTLIETELPQKRFDPCRLHGAVASFGPPALRLAGLGTLTADPGVLTAAANGPRPESGTTRRATPQRVHSAKREKSGLALPSIVKALADVEERLGRVERTTARVVTDASFGIGPPVGQPSLAQAFVSKPLDAGMMDKPLDAGFDAKPLDAGFLDKPLDAGFADKPLDAGFADKPLDAGFGSSSLTGASDSDLGGRIVFASSDEQLASVATVDLFRQVARALAQMESAVVRLERVVLGVLMAPYFGDLLPDQEYRAAVQQLVDDTFDFLMGACDDAHRSVRFVLGHPTFGLGLGPLHLGREDRVTLAAYAGLSRQRLRLLGSSAE